MATTPYGTASAARRWCAAQRFADDEIVRSADRAALPTGRRKR